MWCFLLQQRFHNVLHQAARFGLLLLSTTPVCHWPNIKSDCWNGLLEQVTDWINTAHEKLRYSSLFSSFKVEAFRACLECDSWLHHFSFFPRCSEIYSSRSLLQLRLRRVTILHFLSSRFLWPYIVSKVWRERKPTRCNNRMFIINFCLNMFRASLCPSSGEQRPYYCIWCVVLVLLDVVGSGCGALCCRMRALWRLLFDSLHTLSYILSTTSFINIIYRLNYTKLSFLVRISHLTPWSMKKKRLE